MRIGRTLPPAATPITLKEIYQGITGCLGNKKESARFELELKKYFGVKYCYLVSSGKAALTLILRALMEIYPDRDEVLIPAFTCFSVPSAIKKAGLKVKTCDINPDTLDFDFNLLVDIIRSTKKSETSTLNNRIVHTKKPLCIIPTHIFGLPADVEKTRKLVGDQIVIVEDAAQAMGSKHQGTIMGTSGDVGFFSLGRGKVLSTVEGGIILTNRDDLGENLSRLTSELPDYSNTEMCWLIVKAVVLVVFTSPVFFWLPKLLPFLKLGETIFENDFPIKRMSTFQSAMSRNWQKKIGKLQETRKINIKFWANLFPEGYVQHYQMNNNRLPDLIRLPVKMQNKYQRDQTIHESEKLGLGIISSYPSSITGIKELADDFKGHDSCTCARQISNCLLTLPIHPYVRHRDNIKIKKLITSSRMLKEK